MSVSWPHDCFVNYMSPLPGLVQVFFIYLFNSVYCWPRMKNEENFALSWMSVSISIYSMGTKIMRIQLHEYFTDVCFWTYFR